MPVVEGKQYNEMPPVVRVTEIVDKFEVEPTFWHPGNVDEESESCQEVHSNDAWNEKLQKNVRLVEIMRNK